MHDDTIAPGTDEVRSQQKQEPRAVPPNSPNPMPDHNTWECDESLRWWVDHHSTGKAVNSVDRVWLHGVGATVGSVALRASADRANHIDPELTSFTRYGERIDDVTFDTSWYNVINEIQASGVCGLPWRAPADGYLLRGAALEQFVRLDMGAMCPISMTTAAIAMLRSHSDNTALIERLGEPRSDHAMASMALTEPQGGSDLAGSTTQATAQPDGTFLLNGHKWFVSHPVADVMFVLAREDGVDGHGSRGLSCFEVYGWLEADSGCTRNGIELLRLKDKLGTRSLPSAEVLLRDAVATRVGLPGDGVRTIIEMVVHTRMDCALGGAGIMSRALSESVWYASQRSAFGAMLVDQPIMRGVLTDLMLEREAALAMALDVTRSFDEAMHSPTSESKAIARILPAIAKYYVTRRSVAVAVEAVEVLGGNGYTEEFPLARMYRDAQVNSTWEGSGNVIVLDVFRAMASKSMTTLDALRAHIDRLLTNDPTGAAERITALVTPPPADVADGRGYVGRLAMALAAALLVQRAAASGSAEDRAIADAWIATRIDQPGPHVFGDGGTRLGDARDLLLTRSCIPAL